MAGGGSLLLTESADRLQVRSARHPSIYGIGFFALDIVRSAQCKTSIRSYAGGTCGNVLAILAYLGWDAHAIASLNGDAASKRVREDLSLAGVKLGLARIAPSVSTPIVVQVIKRESKDVLRHQFERACLECGHVLPDFMPVPVQAVSRIAAAMPEPSVFFMDRVSRSSIELARIAAERGALVYLEPSDIEDADLFEEAISVTHVVKYAKERLPSIGDTTRSPSVLAEIRTVGSEGLIYRSRLSREGAWSHIDSVPAPVVVDACGAGDWCTAGIIATLGAKGVAGLVSCQERDLADAMRYGQALAAWNCGFEGARGGMYRVKRSSFARQVAAILGAEATPRARRANAVGRLRVLPSGRIACPACPPILPTARPRR